MVFCIPFEIVVDFLLVCVFVIINNLHAPSIAFPRTAALSLAYAQRARELAHTHTNTHIDTLDLIKHGRSCPPSECRRHIIISQRVKHHRPRPKRLGVATVPPFRIHGRPNDCAAAADADAVAPVPVRKNFRTVTTSRQSFAFIIMLLTVRSRALFVVVSHLLFLVHPCRVDGGPSKGLAAPRRQHTYTPHTHTHTTRTHHTDIIHN